MKGYAMDVEYFPLITSNDYAAFREILGDKIIPDSHDEWLVLQKKEIRDFVQAGRKTKEVQVSAHEFSRFLRAKGDKATLVSLRNFTIEKAAGGIF
jgi:hypothetical protein